MPTAMERVKVSNPENLERVLLNPELFIRAIPNSTVVSEGGELRVRIGFKLFLFSARDDYTVTFYTERKGYVYEFKGKKSRLTFRLRPEKDELVVEAIYDGRLKRLIGLEFRKFAEQLAENLEALFMEIPPAFKRRVEEGTFEVDFENPQDFKRKLYGFLLEKTEEVLISEGTLLQVAKHLIGDFKGVYYLSGISTDGKRRFQLVLQDGKPTSVRYVDDGKSRIARLSLNPSEIERIIKDVAGDFVINIWRKVGRV